MGKLRRFLARPWSEKTLLFCALGWLGAVRSSLALLRFHRTRRWLERGGRGGRGAASDPEPDLRRVRWAVNAASRLLPGTRCLAQALAGQVLLARRGVPTSLRIGVERSSEAMSAHAWL
ncbi:MAG: lasso peptide biosynthesis B2 protein, partial [Planctomycetota bacterium]